VDLRRHGTGPVLRGKIGDRFEITLVNDGTIGHSIDFHAGMLAPDRPMRTIQPGESLTYTFTAVHAGIWMYHCSTMPMSMHIANGMFGAVIIDPPDLAPVDREYLLVQSEFYLGAQGETADADRIATQQPDGRVQRVRRPVRLPAARGIGRRARAGLDPRRGLQHRLVVPRRRRAVRHGVLRGRLHTAPR
jgi:FtsP/CotA-like multicopper oxidase with cupredoxin domain